VYGDGKSATPPFRSDFGLVSQRPGLLQARVFTIGQLSKMEGFQNGVHWGMRNAMPNDSHRKAAEFHELAAHAHRAASVHHGKEDHQTGHEYSKQALEHANKALQWSQEAHGKSVKSTETP